MNLTQALQVNSSLSCAAMLIWDWPTSTGTQRATSPSNLVSTLRRALVDLPFCPLPHPPCRCKAHFECSVGKAVFDGGRRKDCSTPLSSRSRAPSAFLEARLAVLPLLPPGSFFGLPLPLFFDAIWGWLVLLGPVGGPLGPTSAGPPSALLR